MRNISPLHFIFSSPNTLTVDLFWEGVPGPQPSFSIVCTQISVGSPYTRV